MDASFSHSLTLGDSGGSPYREAPRTCRGLLQINVRGPDALNFDNSVPLILLVGGQASRFNVAIAVK